MSSELSIEEKIGIISEEVSDLGFLCETSSGRVKIYTGVGCDRTLHLILKIFDECVHCTPYTNGILYDSGFKIPKVVIESSTWLLPWELPVEDIFNIQPHEYGLLKLKYGISKAGLYIPSFYRGYIKGVWEQRKKERWL